MKASGAGDGQRLPRPRGKLVVEPGAGHEQLNPPDSGAKFRIVGVGASAGGLHGLETFFSNMPPDTGMAFVVIQHLATQQPSIMAELLARRTRMPTMQVKESTPVEPNNIYLIAPNSTLTIREGVLHLTKPAEPVGHRSAIDRFFVSLAEDRGENAVGIVLSGAGSDGTLGIKAIKEHGGVTMAQKGAEHPSMPLHAIATGVVDFVLPVEELPGALLEFLRYQDEVRAKRLPTITDEIERRLGELTSLLRRKTGHDFSQYKPNTIVRRTQRRMQLLQMESVGEYLLLLREDPAQVEALFRDLLIGVTYFFRDAEAFKQLEKLVVPAAFRDKGADDTVRVWVPGCATGEESYSIGILLREYMAKADVVPKVQIFATDIDSEALSLGRDGVYGPSITEQVSRERLERFFARQAGGYAVNKDLRNLCLFSVHNLIKDPPFSRLDLISCRNVLIYMNSELQRRLMQLFHYALRPGGFLFLGPSESVSGHTDLFEPVDKASGIFQRKDAVFTGYPNVPHTHTSQAAQAALAESQFMLQRMPEHKSPDRPTPVDIARSVDRMLLTYYGPPCVVVNRRGEAVYFSGATGRYLQPPQGHPTNDVLEMARRGLRTELRAAIHECAQTGRRVTREGVMVQTNGSVEPVDLLVQPLATGEQEPQLLTVVFQPSAGGAAAEPAAKKGKGKPAAAARRREEHQRSSVRHLEEELAATRQHLQSTIEELESSNEELKSMNEELLSMNEELQSANEEVETSREELQSVNEELETVNAELASKVKELARTNDDLKNLFASARIPTIFLDQNLRVKGFTPAATDIFRLIDTDTGRPLMDIASRFALGDLAEEARKVMRDLTPVERQVRVADAQDSWHLMRILPYRTHENVISGVVLTFVDLGAVKRAEEMGARLAAIAESSADAILGTDARGRITAWNAAAQRLFGFTPSEVLGRPITMLIPAERRDEEQELLERVGRGERIAEYETVRLTREGRPVVVSLSASPIQAEDGTVIGKSSILRDITERKRSEEHQRVLVDELDHRVKNTLAMVSALCSQSAQGARTVEEFREAFQGRIQAMAAAHRQLSRGQWRGADLHALTTETLAPHATRDGTNLAIDGPKLVLTPRATVSLAMVLHELATNAAKYGALSGDGAGQVQVQWGILQADEASRLQLRWIERLAKARAASKPPTEGFGSALIQRTVQYELGGKFHRELDEHGCVCTVDVPWTAGLGVLRD